MAIISNSKNLNILNALATREERTAFFAGGKATIGYISQVESNRIIRRYVGKVRGIVVQFGDQCIFDTPDEALDNARKYLAGCKKEMARIAS